MTLTDHENSILEKDTAYRTNMTCLILRINQGKLPRQAFATYQPWLAQSALRRHRQGKRS